MDSCCDTNSPAVLRGKETDRQGTGLDKRDMKVRYHLSLSSLSEGGSVYFLGTVEFSHLSVQIGR